jgi:hypothetical protein
LGGEGGLFGRRLFEVVKEVWRGDLKILLPVGRHSSLSEAARSTLGRRAFLWTPDKRSVNDTSN